MKKKYRLRKSADNLFTNLTGTPAIQLSGSSNCLVTKQKKIILPYTNAQTPIKKAAYHLYNDIPLDEIGIIKQSCGVDQCVHPDHLYESNPKKEIDAALAWGM